MGVETDTASDGVGGLIGGMGSTGKAASVYPKPTSFKHWVWAISSLGNEGVPGSPQPRVSFPDHYLLAAGGT